MARYERYSKNVRKKHLEGESCQEDLWQGNYLGGQINSMTKNIGEGWRGIGKDGKVNDQEG